MPKFKTEEKLRDQLSEPIEFELGGKEFTVDHVPMEAYSIWLNGQVMDANTKKVDISKMLDRIPDLIKAMIGAEEWEALQPLDGREVFQLGLWLSTLMGGGMEGTEKNLPTASP